MDQIAGSEIVVIGSANSDFIMKMDRLPRAGETVTNATFGQALGGKGANQAVAAARSSRGAGVGAPAVGHVSFVASVGNDQYAADMVISWGESGLDTSHLSRAGRLHGERTHHGRRGRQQLHFRGAYSE